MRSLPAPQRNLYEICLYSSELSIRNYEVKLFIDVDITGEQWEPEKKGEFVNSIFVKFCNVVNALYNIEYKFQNM